MKKTVSHYSHTAILLTVLSPLMLSTANALEINPTAQSYVDTMVETNSDLNVELAKAITQFPSTAESLVAAAIIQVGENSPAIDDLIATAINALGTDSPLIDNILIIAADAGVNRDNLIAIAIANGVDPTLATEALAVETAAGGVEEIISGGGSSGDGGTGDSGGGTGGGGGGGGISQNQ